MRVCFIQREAFQYFGIMSMSGYLRQFGFFTDVLIANLEENLYRHERSEILLEIQKKLLRKNILEETF